MQQIGHFEILSVIGYGGMGTVYRARDPRFDRLVALKVLHRHFQRDPGIVQRFKAEAVIQAKLQHPHIVTLYDFLADEDSLAIVMEYVEGRPLDQIIDQAEEPLSSDWCIKVMEQVLSATGFAHSRELVHRDLKPSNILIVEELKEPFAKITDFGIAKVLGSEKLRTSTGAKMGTLAYMSPEHVRNPKSTDARSDIYALGVTLYQMLTGELPFQGETDFELMKKIIEEPAQISLSMRPEVLPVLGEVIGKAIAKEPSQRYQTCEEMRIALLGSMRSFSIPAVASEERRAEVTISRPGVQRAEAAARQSSLKISTDSQHWLIAVGLAALVIAALILYNNVRERRQEAQQLEERQRVQQRLELENERLKLEAQRIHENAANIALREQELRRQRDQQMREESLIAEEKARAERQRELELEASQRKAEADRRVIEEQARLRQQQEKELDARQREADAERLKASEKAFAQQQLQKEAEANGRNADISRRLLGRWSRTYTQKVARGGRQLDATISESWRFDGNLITVECTQMDIGGVSILDLYKARGYQNSDNGPLAINGAKYSVSSGNIMADNRRGAFFILIPEFPTEDTLQLKQVSGDGSIVLNRQ